MTKKHFIFMAETVRNILEGCWTDEPPNWADLSLYQRIWNGPIEIHLSNYTRAVQTAEAFILVCRNHNPKFDETRFLTACGLIPAVPKARATRSPTI